MKAVAELIAAVAFSFTFLVANPAPPSQQQGVEDITIAMVREDSAVIPFARFREGRWTAPARPGNRVTDSTGNIEDHPFAWFAVGRSAPSRWYHWVTPDSALTLNASAQKEVENHCQKNWALATNLGAMQPLAGSHHKNLGIAADVARTILPTASEPDTSSAWKEAFELMRAAFDTSHARFLARESQLVRNLFQNPTSTELRVTLTRVSSRSAAPLYYAVAERLYRDDPINGATGCPSLSRLTGWTRAGTSGRLMLFGMEHDGDGCDKKGMPGIRVLGAATLAGRNFVFVEEHFYEWESYSILEVLANSSRRVMRVYGGGC